MTTDQVNQALALLRSIVSDIEGMRHRDEFFGPFSEWATDHEDSALIEWPNLSIVGRDIADFLVTLKESAT